MKQIIKYFVLASGIPIAMQAQIQDITIDASVRYQEIESFAASDCWIVKDLGFYWEESVKNRVVKELFSLDVDHRGNPVGIGLSMWRFNLGAGSENDPLMDPRGSTESFLNETSDGYDWNKQAGQQWFMDRVREYGCDNIVAFSNSPLVKYTKNGKGYANKIIFGSNLRDDRYEDYAEYCADVMKHFEDEGKGFKYFSPVNEPQYAWDGNNQEGSPWENNNISKLVRELDKSFQKRNIETKLLITEAGDWTHLTEKKGRATDQINEFFNPSSSNYVANLPSMAPIIGAHSYWTTDKNEDMKNIRLQVQSKANEYDINVFQTEYSMLSGGEGIPSNLGEASFMDNAIFLSKVIHTDLEHAQVTSWSYWTAFGEDLWGHKNRFQLITVVPGDGPAGSMKFSGTAEANKNLWALGNYSYFIRPGYQRIRTKGAADLAGLMCTSFIAPDSSRIVAVYVNIAYAEKKFITNFQNLEGVKPITNKRYLTNSLNDLQKYGSVSSEIYSEGKEFTIPARSIMTIVYDLEKEVSTSIENTHAAKFDVSPNPVRRGDRVEIDLGSFSGNSATVNLTSMNGILVFQKNIQLEDAYSNLEIPSQLQPGVYLMQINTINQNYRSKLIIQ